MSEKQYHVCYSTAVQVAQSDWFKFEIFYISATRGQVVIRKPNSNSKPPVI